MDISGAEALRRLTLSCRASAVRSAIFVDLTILCGLVVLAFGARLPNLWTIPTITDEANEVLRGLEIAQGQILPATNVATYLSAFFNYLLAGLFWVAGPSPYLARTVVLITGVLTVVATYFLAQELATSWSRSSQASPIWYGRLTGLTAAGLLSLNSAHVLVNSHVAWSHSMTPLFSTLSFWLLHRAVTRNDIRLLFWTALILGIMIHSHTTAIALLPGALIYVFWRRSHWLLDQRVWLMALLIIAINSNLLIYNVLTEGDSVVRAFTASEAYARGALPGWDLYFTNLNRLGLSLLRVTSGAGDVRADVISYLLDPLVWIVPVLVLAGIGLTSWRRDPFTLCVATPYLLLFAYFSSKFQVVPNGRYLTPILPLLLSMAGLALAELVTMRRGRDRLFAISIASVLVIGAIALAVGSLLERTTQLTTSSEISQTLIGAIETLESRREANEPVALDPDLDKLWLDGGGDYHRAFRYHLLFRNIPASDLETRPQREQGALDSCKRALIELRHVEPVQTPLAPRLLVDDPATNQDESLQSYWLVRTVQARDRARDAERGQAQEWRTVVVTYDPPFGASARAVDRCMPGLLI